MEWNAVGDKKPPLNRKVLAYSEGADRIYIAKCPSRKKDNEHWIICEEDCSCVGLTGPISHWIDFPLTPPQLHKFYKKMERFKRQRKKIIEDHNTRVLNAYQNDHPEKTEED